MLRPEAVHLTPVPQQLLEALAAETAKPQAPPPTSSNVASNAYYTSRLLVDRWLTDRGVAFRIKPEPDGKGRTVYVLAQCPLGSFSCGS